jgi:molybdopterin-guanine dinucleotide biosynthesis protein A
MDDVIGVVLAGGRGSRMGGADKGLVSFQGRALVEWTAQRLRPQVAELLISANRNIERYAALGYPVVQDEFPDYAGPLAGLHAALARARFDLVCSVPCDGPCLPLDLVQRLRSGLDRTQADIAIARAAGRVHPVFCLCRKGVRQDLEAYLSAGERRLESWYRRLRHVEVDFDDPAAFRNINTPDDLA